MLYITFNYNYNGLLDIRDIHFLLEYVNLGTTTTDGQWAIAILIFEPVHGISNNVVCATSKASDQPAHTRSLFRACASRLSIL